MVLNNDRFQASRAFFVIVNGAIDPSAYGIASHQPSIVGPQQFRYLCRVLHSRIEPKIVAVWIKDDWHSVVNRRCNSIRTRR